MWCPSLRSAVLRRLYLPPWPLQRWGCLEGLGRSRQPVGYLGTLRPMGRWWWVQAQGQAAG